MKTCLYCGKALTDNNWCDNCKKEIDTEKIINENIENVENGKPLTAPLVHLNGLFKKKFIKKHPDPVKAKRRAYYQKPEVKAKRKAYMKAYHQRPEVKAKKRAYYQKHKHDKRSVKKFVEEKKKERGKYFCGYHKHKDIEKKRGDQK